MTTVKIKAHSPPCCVWYQRKCRRVLLTRRLPWRRGIRSRQSGRGGNRIKEATADKLCHDFRELQFKAGECVEDFSLRILAHANQL
jgi:hypothetical protein